MNIKVINKTSEAQKSIRNRQVSKQLESIYKEIKQCFPKIDEDIVHKFIASILYTDKENDFKRLIEKLQCKKYLKVAFYRYNKQQIAKTKKKNSIEILIDIPSVELGMHIKMWELTSAKVEEFKIVQKNIPVEILAIKKQTEKMLLECKDNVNDKPYSERIKVVKQAVQAHIPGTVKDFAMMTNVHQSFVGKALKKEYKLIYANKI